MVIPVFDCEVDAYWWVLCTEKYFKRWDIPEMNKMAVAAIAMKGPALTWWLRWYPRHLWMNWDAFTAVFLWKFKPEWRVILPVPDDEEEAIHESSLLMSQSVFVDADSTITVNDLSKSALESSTIANTTIFVDEIKAQLVVDEDSVEQLSIVESFSEDKEELKFQSQPLAQGGSADEQSTVVEEEIRDFNQLSSSPVVADLYFAYSKEELVLVTFASAPAIALSMKTTVNTTPPQHLVPLFDPGGNFGMQELLTTKEFTPPPKPPDQSFQKILVEFHVICNLIMLPPPPEPPDADHIAVKYIALPSCVALAACPPTVWENVCVNCMKIISIGLLTVSVYLYFKEVFVLDMSNDTCVLGCHMFLLHSDWNLFQPAPPFMSSQSIPPVQHLRENECEQVILVVYLGSGSYGPIALEYGYTKNVFEKCEVYSYGIVLFNVLISKPINEKWQQAPHSHMQGFTHDNSNDKGTLREWGSFIVLASHMNRKKPCDRKVVRKFEKVHTVMRISSLDAKFWWLCSQTSIVHQDRLYGYMTNTIDAQPLLLFQGVILFTSFIFQANGVLVYKIPQRYVIVALGLDDFIIQSMVSLSHKKKLIDDCVSQSCEIAIGTAFSCHCLKPTFSSCKDACLGNCSCHVLFYENRTARSFHLDQIGSFQHFKRVKNVHVSYMLVSINGGEDVLNLHPSLALGCKNFTTLYANEKGIVCGFKLNFIVPVRCLIFIGLLARLKVDRVAPIGMVEFVQQGREKFSNLEVADKQEYVVVLCNGCTLALVGLENILQQLQKLALEPYQVRFLSYMNDLSHDGATEVVGLISFSAIICVAAATEGLLSVITLSLAIGKRSSNFGIQCMAFKLSGNHGNITCTTPYIFVGNIIFHSIMAHAGIIFYEEIHYYDFSKMIDICDIGPWRLIDPTINLCKVVAVIDANPHTKSFYEDELVFRSSCFDLRQLNTLNQKLTNYGAHDYWPTSAINNFVGTGIAHSGYHDYHAFDWHIAWVCKVVRDISSAPRQDFPPVKHLHFKQWDPGKMLVVLRKINLTLDDTLEATWVDTTIPQQHCFSFNLEDKVDFNGRINVMIQNSI